MAPALPGQNRSACVLAALGLALALAAGCEPDPGGLHVVIEGDLEPGTDFDRLSVVAYLAEAPKTPLFSDQVEGEALKLPFTFNLQSGPGTAAGTRVEVLASAERDGEVVSADRGESTLAAGDGARLVLTLPPLKPAPDAGPALEVCDDGVDDDGDGRADCADEDCDLSPCQGGGLACRAGSCTCPTGVAGRYRAPVTGFADRTGASALYLTGGSRAGWLLIAGGEGPSGESLQTVELYQPTSVQLESSQLVTARKAPALAALADGGVAVIGGRDDAGDPLPDVERLTFAAAGAAAATVQPSSPREVAEAQAVPWEEGAMVLGEVDGEAGRLVRLRLGEGAEAFEDAAPAQAAFSGMAAVSPGRLVLASGPQGTDATALVTPSGFVPGPTLPVRLAAAAVSPLPGDRALVAGGTAFLPDGGQAASARAFVLQVQGEVLAAREVPALPEAMSRPRAQALGNGWVYLEDQATGGAGPVWFDPAAERFVPAPASPAPSGDEAWAGMERALFRTAGGTGSFLDLACGP